MFFNTSQLMNYRLHATDGELGKVKDLYIDGDKWKLDYVLVDTGRWLPGRKVLLSPVSFEKIDTENEELYVKHTKDEVKSSPEYDESQYIGNEEAYNINRYYGWGTLTEPILYAGGQTPTVGITPNYDEHMNEGNATESSIDKETGDHYDFRSFDDLVGLRVHADNGRIGVLEDLIFSDRTNAVEAIVVKSDRTDTGGELYAFDRLAIERTDAKEGDIYLNLTAQDLETKKTFTNVDGILEAL